MPLLDADFERARRRSENKRAIARLLDELGLQAADRQAILLDLLVDLEEAPQRQRIPESPAVMSANSAGETATARAFNFISARPNGATVSEVALAVYPGEPKSTSVRRARATLRWLIKSGKAKLDRGRYTAVKGVAVEGRRHNPDSLPNRTFEIIKASVQPISSADVLEKLKTTDPDLKAELVYSAIFRMNKTEKIIKFEKDGKAMYAVPKNGG